MSPHERFTGAVAALPGPVREWLDVDTPLGWSVLGDAATGDAVYKAARRHQRLPHEVEVLVERLIREVGIMPADVAASAEAGRSSSAWVHAVAVEPEGQKLSDSQYDQRRDPYPRTSGRGRRIRDAGAGTGGHRV